MSRAGLLGCDRCASLHVQGEALRQRVTDEKNAGRWKHATVEQAIGLCLEAQTSETCRD